MHASLCDQLADLVQNALEAGATRVTLRVAETVGRLDVAVGDNGCGMSEAVQARALDPFYSDGRKHPNRRMGLGLAFLRQMVEATGGGLELRSAVGTGTDVRFWLDARHVDMPPMGDWGATLTGMMAFPGDYELEIERRRGDQGYRIRRSELIEALGELETATSLAMARDYVASQEEALTMRKGQGHGSNDT